MSSALDPAVHCRIQLLGSPGITTGAGHLSTTRPLVFGAALYIGLQRGQSVSRAELSTLLWPDVDRAARGARLRWLVHQLRRAGLPARARRAELALTADEVRIDLDELEGAASVEEVLAQPCGGILSGYEPDISDLYSRWLDETRDRTRSRVVRTLTRWLNEAQQAAAWSTAEELARRVLVLDELHERASLALVEALVMQGRGEHAAEVLARYRAELGDAAPTSAVRFVQKQIAELASREEGTGAPTPLVGRAGVVARLLASVGGGAGPGRGIVLAGPPGIGKSRVLGEFATVARLRGARVVRLACSRADAFRPLSLVTDVARSLLALRGALGASPASIEVLRRLPGDSAGAAGAAPSGVDRAAVYAGLGDLLDALVGDRWLAIVADDVQWVEPGAWEILGPLMGQHARVSWVFGLRSDSVGSAARSLGQMSGSAIRGEGRGELVWLAPLIDADVRSLCAMHAAPRGVPPDVVEVIVERAAGIPFVAEALVEQWCAAGALVSLPPSVTRLVSARLERLSPAATHIIEAVAVLGADADAPAVAAVATLDRVALLDGLRELDARGMLRSSEGGVIAVHALWAEAVLPGIPRSVLQLRHRYAAEWLEQEAWRTLVADRRRLGAIASHWRAAGDGERARSALERAERVLLADGVVGRAGGMVAGAGETAAVSPVVAE